MNPARNEFEMDLGSEKILLRPTFENLSAMESKLGGLAYLTFKFAKTVETGVPNMEQLTKSFPSFTETTQIIFFNQVEKKYSLEQIHELVMETGIKACAQAVHFLVKCTAGSTKTKLSASAKKKS